MCTWGRPLRPGLDSLWQRFPSPPPRPRLDCQRWGPLSGIAVSNSNSGDAALSGNRGCARRRGYPLRPVRQQVSIGFGINDSACVHPAQPFGSGAGGAAYRTDVPPASFGGSWRNEPRCAGCYPDGAADAPSWVQTFHPGRDTLGWVSFKIHMSPHLLMDRQLIGDRVKRLRLAHGWSQTELANRAGVSRNTVVRMETSAQGLSIDAYLVVADALGVQLWQLFRDEEAVQDPERTEDEGREEDG